MLCQTSNFRVDRFQFHAGVADFELPVHAALPGVAVLVPSGRFLARSISIVAKRRPVTHCRVIELSSFSAMFSQLPCLGV